jgi:hypothetical protein
MTANTAAKDEGRMMPSVAGSTTNPGSFLCDEHRRLFRAFNIHFGAGAVNREVPAFSTEKFRFRASTVRKCPRWLSLTGLRSPPDVLVGGLI